MHPGNERWGLVSLFRGVGARGQELGRGGLGCRSVEPWNGLGERTQMQTGICMAFPPCLPACPPPSTPAATLPGQNRVERAWGKRAPEGQCHRSSLSQLTNCQKVLEKGSKGEGRKKGMPLAGFLLSHSLIHSLSLGADLCLTQLRCSGPRKWGWGRRAAVQGSPCAPHPLCHPSIWLSRT